MSELFGLIFHQGNKWNLKALRLFSDLEIDFARLAKIISGIAPHFFFLFKKNMLRKLDLIEFVSHFFHEKLNFTGNEILLCD